MKDFCVIGAGRLGLSMIGYIAEKGDTLSVVARSRQSQVLASEFIPEEMIFRTIDKLFYLPKFFIVAVSDGNIKEISHQLATFFADKLTGSVVVHCSGASGTELLEECGEAGATIIAAHPFQTFNKPSGRLFDGVFWGVESDDSAGMAKADEFVRYFGGEVVPVKKKARELYHLAAVAASNYLSSAAYLGKLFATEAGIDFSKIAGPLMTQSVKNVLYEGDFPITGPIARNDTFTVQKHLQAIAGREELVLPYCYMGLATLELVKCSRHVESGSMAKLRLILLGAISECKKYKNAEMQSESKIK